MRGRLFAVVLFVVAMAGLQPAASQASDFSPRVGQPGKDVVWVPTPDVLVARMLDAAKVTPQDVLVDLGSGDGRTVIAAAKRGVEALGIEYNPDMVVLAERNARLEGVAARARFVQGDIFATDFSKATVVTMYLLPTLNLKLRPQLLAMKPGTRLVSHAFHMGDWSADEIISVDGYSAYLWIVPAKVQGRWQVTATSGAFELVLEQAYQKVSGLAAGPGLLPNVADPVLSGNTLSFTLVSAEGEFLRFRGTVDGDRIEGTAQGGSGAGPWTARRAG